MLGLVSFIADLRNARARELEEKRINKELANIRFVRLLIPGTTLADFVYSGTNSRVGEALSLRATNGTNDSQTLVLTGIKRKNTFARYVTTGSYTMI